MSYASRTANVASGQTTSEAIHIGDHVLAGIQTPGTLTSTAMTFLGSTTQTGTYAPIYRNDTAISLTVAASRFIELDDVDVGVIWAAPWIKLVCGSAEGGARVFNLALK